MKLGGMGSFLIGVAAVTLFLLAVGIGLHGGWLGAWRLLGVPTLLPPFLDLHAVTDAAACAARGLDPFLDPGCDVHGRRFVYPPIWLWLGDMGVTGASTVPLALAIECVAIGVIAALFWRCSVVEGLVAFLAILSPSVLTAFERGNNDLVILILIIATAIAFSERTRWRFALAWFFIAIGIVLKIYPAFAVALLARFSRVTVLWAVSLLVLAILYVISIHDAWTLMQRNIPRDAFFSYGTSVIFWGLGLLPRYYPSVIALAGSALAAAAGLRYARTMGPMPLPLISSQVEGTAFILGAGIFCGTFIFGDNYAYKLSFLILCLPQIFAWINNPPTSTIRNIGYLQLASVFAVLWLIPFPRVLIVPQVMSWALFFAFEAVLSFNFFGAVISKRLLARSARPGS